MRGVRILQTVLAGLLLAASWAPPLLAAPVPSEGLSLTTSPLPISLVALPGTTVSTQLRVRNSGTQAETLQIGLMKFKAYGEEGKPILLDRGPADSYFDWVHFSQTQFTAEPGVWKTITMTIDVPKSAAFGYYYAVTFSRASQTGIQSGTRGTSIHGAAATLVLLEARVPGAKRQIDVVSFAPAHHWYEFLPVSFNLRLHNAGNVHAAPIGSIFISKGGGSTITAIDINKEGGNILPGSNRIFSAQWADGFPAYVNKVSNGAAVLDKNGQNVRQLKWDFSQASKLRMGKYTATVFMVYDNGQRDIPVQATTTFWVVPWRLLGALALVLALVAVGLWSVFRGLWKNTRRGRRA